MKVWVLINPDGKPVEISNDADAIYFLTFSHAFGDLEGVITEAEAYLICDHDLAKDEISQGRVNYLWEILKQHGWRIAEFEERK